MFLKKRGTLLSLIILLVINLFSYHMWFFGNPILTYGDWTFAFPETLAEYSIPQAWLSSTSFGALNLGLTFAPKFLLNGWLAKIGASPQFNNQLTYLWPTVILSSLGMFFLGKKIFSSNLAGLFSSLFFTHNVVTIAIRTGHLTLASAQAIVPLSFLLLIKTFESRKPVYAIATALITFMISFSEARVFYLYFWILLLYIGYISFVVKVNKDGRVKNLALSTIIVLIIGLLNFFWIFSFVSVSPYQNSDFEFLGRPLYGINQSDILKSFTVWNIWWTGSKQASSIQPIPALFWIIPLMAILGFYFNRKNKYVLFVGLVVTFGIFFSKQVGQPFPGVYPWLFRHFPGFSAFREASKFLFPVILGFSVFFGGFVHWLVHMASNHRIRQMTVAIILSLIAAFFLWNAKPLITGEIGALFVPRSIPSDYTIFKNFVYQQPSYFRTLWVPISSKWSFFSNSHPKLSGIELINAEWRKYVFDRVEKDPRATEQDLVIHLLKEDMANSLLDAAAIKYVVVPLQDTENDDDFFAYYGSRQEYINALDRLSYLKEINIGTSRIKVYENQSFRPQILLINNNLSEEINYLQVAPTRYEISFNNFSPNSQLVFSEKFHPDWKIHIGDFNWISSLFDKKYFYPDQVHTQSQFGFNEFQLNPELLNKNAKLTIYFAPQAKLNLGLIISISTLLISVVTLIILLIFRKHELS